MKTAKNTFAIILAIFVLLCIPYVFESGWLFLISWVPAVTVWALVVTTDYSMTIPEKPVNPQPMGDPKRWCSRLMQPCSDNCSGGKCKHMDAIEK